VDKKNNRVKNGDKKREKNKIIGREKKISISKKKVQEKLCESGKKK